MFEKIKIHTLGEFSISYGDVTISDYDNRSKKIWLLLEFLISFHSKEISLSALIDLLWPEESSSIDPENALKTILHRTRALLDTLNYKENKLIIRRRDTIAWNNEIPFEIDAELFEEYCMTASASDICDEKKIYYYNLAFQLYRGDYLTKSSDETWAIPLTTYYHSLYLKSIYELVEILLRYTRFHDIITYCSAASIIDPCDEKIHYYLILALYRTGKHNAALEQYQHVIDMLYNDFGLNPSKELISLYTEIMNEERAPEMDLNLIQENLKEENAQKKAYYCNTVIFKNLYQIESRSIARSGLSVYLCLITLTSKDPSNKQSLPNAMAKMHNVISSSLRCGDVFTRYSVNQYLIMLPTANYENCIKIGERILKSYDKMKPQLSKITSSYSIKHVQPQSFSS